MRAVRRMTEMDDSRVRESCEYGPADVECPVCGKKDNHCRNRRGLCIWCYCALADEIGEDAFHAMPKDELERKAADARKRAAGKGLAPKIGKRRNTAAKGAEWWRGEGFRCDKDKKSADADSVAEKKPNPPKPPKTSPERLAYQKRYRETHREEIREQRRRTAALKRDIRERRKADRRRRKEG